MSLSLDNIRSNKKKRKILGRGNASGNGNYSGRGLKGQKARSGVTGLKRLGMRQMLLAAPKLRGFKSDKPANQIVKASAINKNFKDGEKIDPIILAKKGLIKSSKLPVKILGGEDLKVKVKFEKVKLSSNISKQLKK